MDQLLTCEPTKASYNNNSKWLQVGLELLRRTTIDDLLNGTGSTLYGTRSALCGLLYIGSGHLLRPIRTGGARGVRLCGHLNGGLGRLRRHLNLSGRSSWLHRRLNS